MPDHAVRQTQELLEQNNPDFITKAPRPHNSLDLNQLDYDVSGAMLERYRIHKPNPRNKVELNAVMEGIWADLPQASIDKAILAFRKRLRDSVNADGVYNLSNNCSNCSSHPESPLLRVTKIIQMESQRD